MSRLADRAKSHPLASFGAALLPPELGGPLPVHLRAARAGSGYVTRLPATTIRGARRAGFTGGGQLLHTGRSPRLHPDERARVLHRLLH